MVPASGGRPVIRLRGKPGTVRSRCEPGRWFADVASGYSPRFSQFGQLGQRTQAAHGAAPQAGLVGGGARAGAGGSGGVDLAGF